MTIGQIYERMITMTVTLNYPPADLELIKAQDLAHAHACVVGEHKGMCIG